MEQSRRDERADHKPWNLELSEWLSFSPNTSNCFAVGFHSSRDRCCYRAVACMASQSLIRPATARRTLSHLLLAGCNPLSPPLAYTSGTAARQSPSNSSITPVPLSNWLGSVGRAEDVAEGWKLLPGGLAAGLAHALLAYRSAGSDRVFAVGRNEAGQLGIGFASQEDTRGMVEGFGGEEILQAAASSQSSYLLLRKQGELRLPAHAVISSLTAPQDSSALYSLGNLSRGRLGQPAFYPPPELEPHQEPILHLLSRATEVRLPPELARAKALATGFEHLLVLSGASCRSLFTLELIH
jgi:alpha-tubulin suppressor-like RCC1 family protein